MMNHHRPSAVLPEASQIAALLEDVMAFDDRMPAADDPTTTAVIRSAPRSLPSTAVPIGWTASELFQQTNWSNQPRERPMSRSVKDTVEAKPLASHTLSELLGFVNWRNAADAPRRSQAVSPATGARAVEFTVHGIMDNFRWD